MSTVILPWRLSRGPQLGPAALAVAVTAALLFALQGPRIQPVDDSPRSVTVWLTPPGPAVPAPAEAQRDRAQRPTRRPDNTGLAHPASSQRTESRDGASHRAAEPDSSPALVVQAPGGSAALNLELPGAAPSTLADQARASIGGEQLTERARLARSITRAGKADCLASNEHGSLLSIFTIAYDAMTDKCK